MNKTSVLDFRENDVCISDPKRVSLIVTALGLPDLLRRSGADEPPGMLFVGYVAHPTHWLLICGFTGAPEMGTMVRTIIGKSKKVYPIEVLDVMIRFFSLGRPCYLRPDAGLWP